MQIAVVGLQGSGKSHYVSKEIIPKNFIKGRRIITNIKGFNVEELKKYCIEVLKAKEEDFGQIVLISDKDIVKQPKIKNLDELYAIDPFNPTPAELLKLDSFYPYIYEDKNHNEIVIDKYSFVKSGDVVVIDEAGRFYKKVSDYDFEFFRMHRHMTNSKGESTELCFMMQTKAMVKRDFFDLMAQVYYCKKLKSLGLSNNYSLQVFDGGSLRRDTCISTAVSKYDKRVFPIYSSYSGGKGKEVALDPKANILKSPKFIIFVIVFFLSCFWSYKSMNSFFHPKTKTTEIESSSTTAPASTTAQVQEIKPQQPQFKIVGVIDLPTKRMVLVEDSNQIMKVVVPSLCIGSGLTMICKIDNQDISYYSQVKPNNNNSYIGGNNNENKKSSPSNSMPTK